MRTSRDAAAHQQLLPRQSGGGAALPLLPLFDAVLLPGGFARVTIPASWRTSASLVELLLQQQGDADVLVAAVPFLTGKPGSSAAAGPDRGGGSDDEGLADDPLDLDRLHHTGTAARVLQLARRTQVGAESAGAGGRGGLVPPRSRLFLGCPPSALLSAGRSPPSSGRCLQTSLACAVQRLERAAGGAVPRAGARRAPVQPAARAVRGVC